VLRVRTPPTGLRPGSTVGRGHHLLTVALPILGPLVAVMLDRGRVVAAVSTAEVAGGLGLATKVGLDGLLTRGVLGGDV